MLLLCCSELQCVAHIFPSASCIGNDAVLQHVAACCSVLQCVAVCGSVLLLYRSELQCIAICCSVLHRVARKFSRLLALVVILKSFCTHNLTASRLLRTTFENISNERTFEMYGRFEKCVQLCSLLDHSKRLHRCIPF